MVTIGKLPDLCSLLALLAYHDSAMISKLAHVGGKLLDVRITLGGVLCQDMQVPTRPAMSRVGSLGVGRVN